MATRTPWMGSRLTDLEARGPFRADHRLVDGLGKGRVWLAGAAAHSASPLSSLSTNVGLSEAAQLAEIFAGAREHDALSALRAYEAEQLERWQRRLTPTPLRLEGDPSRLAPADEPHHPLDSATAAPDFDTLLARLTV